MMSLDLDASLRGLAAAAPGHAASDTSARAALATATARSVAATADAWVETAVAIKSRVAGGIAVAPAAAVIAEETATGPLATLRLLAITARALRDVARTGMPQPCDAPRVLHESQAGAGPGSFVGVEMLPEKSLLDGTIFRGHAATVRCVNPGGIDAFMRSWREEARERPRQGGVAVVLGAGNVTGLAAADAISQIFEYGRAVLLKIHPLHAPLEPVLRQALAPLVEAGLLAIVSGGSEVAQAAVAASLVTHVHFTGGQGTFDAVVWGRPGPHPPHAQPVLMKPITCELGNVTPWIVVPGRYTPAQLAFQADSIAASIANNTSFNCIATKAVITCRSWDQREEFTRLIMRRLASLPSRPAWYPGAAAAWAEITGRQPPGDGSLPAVFRPGRGRDVCPDRRRPQRPRPAPADAAPRAHGLAAGSPRDSNRSPQAQAGGSRRGSVGAVEPSAARPRLPPRDPLAAARGLDGRRGHRVRRPLIAFSRSGCLSGWSTNFSGWPVSS
jgi:hypothetical protein